MDIIALYELFKDSNGVSTDTRSLLPNQLYFGLKGERFDGGRFTDQALEKGAKLAIVESGDASRKGVLMVDSVLECLQKLANYHRKQLNTKIIGLTGSNGKTTTKELLHAILSKKYSCQATIGNYNNHIGVPLTLLSIQEDTEIAIIEMGANHLKEIELLSQIAEPDYGFITNFGLAHIEGFGSAEGIVKGKSELYEFLINSKGVIFYNQHDDQQKEILKGYDKTIELAEKMSVVSSSPQLKMSWGVDQFQTKLAGTYNQLNLEATAGIGQYFGVDRKKMISALEEYTPSNMRSQLIELDGNKFILDAYNANPSSVKLALKSLSEQPEFPKLAILGDMLELGDQALIYHQEVVEFAKSLKIELFLVGPLFEKTDSPFRHFEDVESLVKYNDWKTHYKLTLIKGSRGMALEKILLNEV